MRRFVRRQTQYFLIGFVITFIVYLFIRFNADAVILGIVIGAGGGAVVNIGMIYLERKFPDEPEVEPEHG